MSKSELDKIFAEAAAPVRKTVKAKRSPAAIVADLEKSLALLAGASNVTRVEISPKKSAPVRETVVKFDPITKRALTREDPLGDENLGTTTARTVRKAEADVDLYSGFVSKSHIDGQE